MAGYTCKLKKKLFFKSITCMLKLSQNKGDIILKYIKNIQGILLFHISNLF